MAKKRKKDKKKSKKDKKEKKLSLRANCKRTHGKKGVKVCLECVEKVMQVNEILLTRIETMEKEMAMCTCSDDIPF